jgi:hypothetical protein
MRFGPPTGFFRVLGSSAQEEGTVMMVMNGQSLPPLPEKSLIREAGMNQNGYQPWPIFVATIPQARLVGSTLCPMNESKHLMREACYGDFCNQEDPSFDQFIPVSSTYFPGNWTSITGRFSTGYFHWMTDDLPRLAALSLMPPDTRILMRGPLRRYQGESLGLLGIQARVHPENNRHLHIERYHFSSPVGMTGCTNPYAVNWLRKQFMNHLESQSGSPRKLFVIRRGKTRGIVNQDSLAVKLASMDWTVIDLEELGLTQQISLFSNASQIVAEHGAALTNLLWCRPGTKVVELCAETFLNGCYEAISLCLGLNHRYEIFKSDASHRINVPLDRLLTLLD